MLKQYLSILFHICQYTVLLPRVPIPYSTCFEAFGVIAINETYKKDKHDEYTRESDKPYAGIGTDSQIEF